MRHIRMDEKARCKVEASVKPAKIGKSKNHPVKPYAYRLNQLIEKTMSSVATYCSMFIALLALAATFYQGYLAREHNRVLVRPRLVGYASKGSAKFRFEIINTGLGPAIIEDIQCFIDGVSVHGVGNDLISNCIQALGLRCRIISTEFFKIGAIIPSGKRIDVLNIVVLDPIEDADNYFTGRVKLEILYKSVYGERLKFNNDDAR